MRRAASRQAYSGVRTRKRNRAAALFLALCTAGSLTACNSDDPNPDVGKSSAPASKSAKDKPTKSADPQAKDKKAVLAAYNGLMTEQSKAYAKASAKGTDLEKYAQLNALSKVELDLGRMKTAGTVARGRIGHDASVTHVDLTAKTPKADISDCVDLSEYETYDTKARKVIPMPTEQPVRYRATAKAERWDGRWLVTDINTQGGPEC